VLTRSETRKGNDTIEKNTTVFSAGVVPFGKKPGKHSFAMHGKSPAAKACMAKTSGTNNFL